MRHHGDPSLLARVLPSSIELTFSEIPHARFTFRIFVKIAFTAWVGTVSVLKLCVKLMNAEIPAKSAELGLIDKLLLDSDAAR